MTFLSTHDENEPQLHGVRVSLVLKRLLMSIAIVGHFPAYNTSPDISGAASKRSIELSPRSYSYRFISGSKRGVND